MRRWAPVAIVIGIQLILVNLWPKGRANPKKTEGLNVDKTVILAIVIVIVFFVVFFAWDYYQKQRRHKQMRTTWPTEKRLRRPVSQTPWPA